MNFEFSEYQIVLRTSIEKYLRGSYQFSDRAESRSSRDGFDTAIWNEVSELGYLSIPFSVEFGGYSGDPIDTLILFEQLGYYRVTEPFLESLALGAQVLDVLHDDRFKGLVERTISGSVHIALAHEERGSSYSLDAVSTQAETCEGGYKIQGSKSVVYNAAAADKIVLSAMIDGERLGLFLVDRDALDLYSYRTFDGSNAAEVSANQVLVGADALLTQSESTSILEQVTDMAILAACSEQVGMMRRLNELTIAYTGQRRQFGSALSDFQVLQHTMADMHVAFELATSLLYAAAIHLRDGNPMASEYLAALKVRCDRSAGEIAHSAFQLHGAIATTDECEVGHHLKRIVVLAQKFGGTEFHLDRFCRLRDNRIDNAA